MHHRLILFLATAMLGLSACKKTESEAPAAPAPLLPASSGWERVGTIPYSYQHTGFANRNGLLPLQLQKTGTDMQVLYCETFELYNSRGRALFKARQTAGSPDAYQTTLLTLNSGGVSGSSTGYINNYFVPGSFEVLGARYFVNGGYTTLGILSESGAVLGGLAGHSIGHQGDGTATVGPDGNVLDGGIDYSRNAELVYYNKAANSWYYVGGTSQDTTNLMTYTPFRLGNGAPLALNITSKGQRTYLSIADPTPVGYPHPLFTSRFLQAKPELGGYASTIMAHYETAGALTFVVGTFATPGSVHVTRISAYKWVPGTTSFTTLYANVPITGTIDGNFRPGTGFCNPDGTAYTLLLDSGGTSMSLVTLDATGQHQLGTVTNIPNTRIGAVSYIDGAYYAVAYPASDANDTNHDMRMEVVRLR